MPENSHGQYYVLVIENEFIKDDQRFNPLLVETLREYADMVENKHAGHEGVEKLFSRNGNKLTIITNTWCGVLLPDL